MMKDFKGTKGNWFTYISPSDERACIGSIGAQQKYFVAEAFSKGRSFEETKANVQLIATAPELLGSLSKLVEMLRSPYVINEEGFLYELDQETERAENIINKALGKEESHE